MALHLEDYIDVNKKNSWNSLRDYIIKTFNISLIDDDNPDKTISKFIRDKERNSLLRSELTEKEWIDFDKNLRNYAGGKTCSLERKSLYILMRSLHIDTVEQMSLFMRTALHEQALSARNLDNFITMCSLKLHLSYGEYQSLIDTYNDKIRSMDFAPKKVQNKVTGELSDNINTITSINDIHTLVKANSDIFSLTRNTTYLMFYQFLTDVNWTTWNPEDWRDFFDRNPENAPDGYIDYSNDDWDDYKPFESGISNEQMQELIMYRYLLDLYHENLEYKDSEYKQYIKESVKNFKNNFVYARQLYADNIRYEDYNKPSDIVISPDQKKRKYLRDSYFNLFSICCENGITEKQISALASNHDFSVAFLSYEEFKNMFNRHVTQNRDISENKETKLGTSQEIKHGVYLLSLLENYEFGSRGDEDDKYYDFDSEDDEDDKYYDFDSEDDEDDISTFKLFGDGIDFVETINNILAEGGFPTLNRNNGFDHLFIDTYKEVARENPSYDDIQNKFLRRLCDYLKEIANLLIEQPQQ